MKKIFLILTAVVISLSTMAQEESKLRVQEAGIGFSGFNDGFALIYKIGNQKSLWRFNTLIFNGTDTKKKVDSLSSDFRNATYAINVGKEFRKILINNLELCYGANLGFSYNYLKQDDNGINTSNYFYETRTYSPNISLIFGLNYVIKDKLVIGAEFLPYITYNFGKTTTNRYLESLVTTDDSGFYYGISNQSVLLSILYRF